MAYCSIDDIITRVPERMVKQLTQDDRVSNEINQSVVDSAISDATAIIDGKIWKRYALPVLNSGILLKLAVDIAIYFIYRNRFDNAMPDEVKKTYTEAMLMLDNIRDGKESIKDAYEATTSASFVSTNKKNVKLVFSQHNLRSL